MQRRRSARAFSAASSRSSAGKSAQYTQMCEQAHQQSYDLLIDHARAVGANAIVGLRYDAAEIGSKAGSATEVLCYGTAVVIEPDTGG